MRGDFDARSLYKVAEQSLLSSNSSVHVNDSFDTATPFVDEVLEVSPVQSGISFGQTLDFIIPHSAPLINDIGSRLSCLRWPPEDLPPEGRPHPAEEGEGFVGTQLVHEYEGAYDAIYDELEQDRSVPHTVLHIPLRVLTGYGRKFAVPLYKLRGSGNDLKIQITVTWAGKYMQSYNVKFTSGTSFRLPFTGVCYEMVIVCDNIKALDSSIHDAHFLRTAIANREHRNVPTRKYLELLQGFADNTDANGAKALAEAADTTDIMPAVQNGAATAASAQYGTEFIYAIPFGTEVADDTKMFGGLDFGAFKTIELTLTTAGR
eukprot:tig00021428_g21188.t1